MPKKAALNFHDVQEAIDWATKPPPEQAAMCRGLEMALFRFAVTRANPGLREAYTDGAHLFEKAAGRANELAFEVEVQHLKSSDEVLPVNKAKINKLAQELLGLAQECHRWSAGTTEVVHLESILRLVSPLDQNGQPVWSDAEFKGLSGRDLFIAKGEAQWARGGISRADILSVPQGKDVKFPSWWATDTTPMRRAAVNLRRVSFKLRVFADQKCKRGGGRPQDGDRIDLLKTARGLGIGVPALSYLMAAFAVEPSWRSNRPVPPGLMAMRHRGRDFGKPLSKTERDWLSSSQAEWLSRLNEVRREDRKKRKRDREAYQARIS